jgi:hypothetical protein
MSETKTGQGERLKFSFEGLDVLMAFGRPAPVVFFDRSLFVVANMGLKQIASNTFQKNFDPLSKRKIDEIQNLIAAVSSINAGVDVGHYCA